MTACLVCHHFVIKSGSDAIIERSEVMNWPGEIIWQQVMALGLPSLAAFSVEILPEIDSTNSELMRRARQGRFEPTLLVAEHQSAGRGRLGRSWQSEPGASLTFSLGLPLAPSSWDGLSLAVGVSLAGSLAAANVGHSAQGIQIKWPNDLWLESRKLAGILIETTGLPPSHAAVQPQERFAVIGIGINVAPRPQDPSLAIQRAALQEIDPASTAQTALERLFVRLLSDLLEFERTGLQGFLSRFAAQDALQGRQVILSNGLTGLAQGVDASGALLVHTSQGLQRVSSDEVSVRPQV
jgi:BirA family transcriptional regulator, biotin operon repressor / biotin---[acetyl-CoA-carboxylase] ligase